MFVTKASLVDPERLQDAAGAGAQPLDAGLTDIAGLAPADGNFIVGNGTNWVAESGATARASLEIITGTWSPILTNTTNVAASTTGLCHYLRVGTHVQCWGEISIDPTAAGDATTILGISLPVASNFAASTDGAGHITNANAQRAGRIVADVANDRMTASFSSQLTANSAYSISFSYIII